MAIDEQDLRMRLEALARHSNAPGFSGETLIGRIQRRRAWIAATCASLLVVAGTAVAVPLALSGTSTPATIAPPIPPTPLSFRVLVNGQSRRETVPRVAGASEPRFVIAAGQEMKITVDVTVPGHVRVTRLWIGVAKGSYAIGSRPSGLRPILAHSTKPLTRGSHIFTFHWAAPEGMRGINLVAAWTVGDSTVAPTIAEIIVS